jgi:hypothetical protein
LSCGAGIITYALPEEVRAEVSRIRDHISLARLQAKNSAIANDLHPIGGETPGGQASLLTIMQGAPPHWQGVSSSDTPAVTTIFERKYLFYFGRTGHAANIE